MPRRILLAALLLALAGATLWLGLRLAADAPGRGAAPAAPDDASEGDARPIRLTGTPHAELGWDELLQRLEEEPDAPETLEALDARTRREGVDHVVARLIALLRAGNEARAEAGGAQTPWAILWALSTIGRPAALPLAELLQEAVPSVSASALIDALGRMGAEAAPAVPLLVAFAESSDDDRVMRAVLRVVHAVGPEATIALPLLEATLTPPLVDGLVSGAAHALLAVTGPTPATLDLLRHALDDADTLARPAILRALGDQGAGAAALVSTVLPLVEDPEEYTRYAATGALGRFGVASDAVVLALLGRLSDGTHGEQNTAAAALVALGDKGRDGILRVALTAREPRERLSALNALARSEGDRNDVVEALLAFVVEDGIERDFQVGAIGLLNSMEPPPDADLLLAPLTAALAVERLETSALRLLARHPDPRLRDAAFAHVMREQELSLKLLLLRTWAARRIDDPRARDMILDLLRDSDPRGAAAGLSYAPSLRPRLTMSEGLDLIRGLGDHPDRGLRSLVPAALDGLAGDDGTVLDLLVAGLAEADWAVGAAYARTLGARPLDAQRSVPALFAALAAQAEDPGAVNHSFLFAAARLTPRWSGSEQAYEQVMANASERAKNLLMAMRSHVGL